MLYKFVFCSIVWQLNYLNQAKDFKSVSPYFNENRFLYNQNAPPPGKNSRIPHTMGTCNLGDQ
jgi:hypothetical protein